jgi:hypothetical protein
MVATCKWFIFHFSDENMPKVTLGKKTPSFLALQE